MYKLNNIGENRLKYVSKEVIKGFIVEPIVFLFISFLVYLSIYSKSSVGFFTVLSYILFMFLFSIFAKLRWLNKHNRTISKLEFLNGEVIIKTEKVLWLKDREYQLKKSDIRIENKRFKWYGKKIKKEGLSIFVNDLELYFVNDYFDDYEDIKKLL